MQATTLTAKARCLATAAALSLLLNSGLAQTASPATPDTNLKPKADEEVIELSPFVVDASKDQGYRATSTLAGSRINTDLKDLGQSITVVTKEFINDVGAVDVNDILSYTANTEGTRDFTATVPTLGRPSDGPASDPQASNRIRGLAAADVTRDYFYTLGTNFGFDTYNLDEVTIVRGPNSILAGLGSPAGIINYSPQLAGLARDSNELSYRFGSFGDQRFTLNSNIVAKKDVLAFRVAGAYSERGYEQQPAWDHDTRLYAAMTYQPWSKTTIRLGYEQVKINANYPNSITPEDDVSQWIALGKPSYNANSATPVSSFLWQDGNTPVVVYNKDGTVGGAFNTATQYYFNQQNLTNVGIWQPLRMNNNNFLQLNKLNTSPSDTDQKLKTMSVSVDQEVVKNLFVNLAFVSEKVDSSSLNLFRPEYANYLVDVNQTTVTGAANPHFGETYMQFRGLDNRQTDNNTNRVGRATANYNLDLTKYNKWLGRYLLTGFYEDRRTETDHIQYNTKTSDQGPNYLLETGARYYLGGSATSPATTVPTQPSLVSGVPFTFPNGSTSPLDTFYWLKSDQKALTQLTTSAFVAQAFLWDDRIVPLFGIRKDKDKQAYASIVDGSSPTTNGFLNPIGPYDPAVTISQTTKTYGVVVHPLKWLSLHYNHAENFIPNAGSVDLLGNTTPTPKGINKEYGVSASLLDDKLNIKLNWFELTAADGSAGNPANFPLAQWNMTFMDLVVEPELAAKQGIAYKQGVAPGLIVGDPRLANAYTADNVSKGLELEVTYNVTKNWRVMANISKQEAKQTNIAPALTAFIKERLAYWQATPGLWTGQVTSNNPWGLQQTGEQHFNQFLLPSYIGYQSVDGQPSTQLRKWHANVVSNYTFNDGALKGWNFGGAARYMEKAVIGNPALYTNGVVSGLDLAHPYYAGGYIGVDAWVGYSTKIYHDKYLLNIQLNGRDLQEGGGFMPIAANSDGTHAVYRIVQPRTWYLTTKIDF